MMIKFCGRVCLMLFILSIVGMAVTLFMRDKVSSYLQASVDKERLLKAKPGPAVIFVGGSNMAFGVDSEALAHELRTPVVNMALHADLGLRYMFNEVKTQLSRGDVVILSLEYEHFYGQLSPNGRTLTQLVLANPSVLPLLSFPGEFVEVASHLYLPFKSFYAYYIACFRDEGTIYSRTSFNAHGDVAVSLPASRRSYRPNMKRTIPPVGKINHQAIDLLNAFTENAEKKGARVRLVFPPISRPEFEHNQAQLSGLYEFLRDNLKLRVVSTPADQVFSAEEFYDTRYHLNSAGRKHRTRLLTQIVAQMLDQS